MKDFLFTTIGLWLAIGILTSLLAAIVFVFIGNWNAMIWALFASSAEGLALRAEYQLWNLKREGKS